MTTFESMKKDIEAGLYKRFRYDPKTDTIRNGFLNDWYKTPGGAWERDKTKTKWEWFEGNSKIIIHSDSTVEVPQHYVTLGELAKLGLGCSIERRNTILARLVYVHRGRDEYVFFPGMRVRLTDGTPVDGILYSERTLNKEKQKVVQKKIAEFRRVFLTYGRVAHPPLQTTLPEDRTWLNHEETGGFRLYQNKNDQARKQLLNTLFESIRLPSGEIKDSAFTKLEELGWVWGTNAVGRTSAFNYMIKLVKPELYAKLAVVC